MSAAVFQALPTWVCQAESIISNFSASGSWTVYLAPLIISFTLVGSFVPREYMFDMYLGLAFGVIGYIARKTGYHVAAILIGIILGPLLETYFLRALKKSDGDLTVLFSSNIGNVLWLLLLLSLLTPAVLGVWRRRHAAEDA